MADTATTVIRRIAAEVLDVMVASGHVVSIEDVRAEVLARIKAERLGDRLLEVVARAAVDYVDRDRRERRQGQLDFGEDFGEVIVVGEGQRRRRGDATLRQIRYHLEQIEQNARRVATAAQLEREKVDRALPYLERGLSWSEACEAWANDHEPVPA